MKQAKFTVAAILASLMPSGAVLAHSDAIDHSAVMTVLHNLAHVLQPLFWLPVALLAALVTFVFISRTNKRES